MNKIELIRERISIKVDNKVERVPYKVFMLMDYMMNNSGRVITRDELLENIWNDVVVGHRTVDVHVRKLRSIIGNNRIETYKKFGYLYESMD